MAAWLFPECRATQRRHIPVCPPSTVGIPDAAGRMTVYRKKAVPVVELAIRLEACSVRVTLLIKCTTRISELLIQQDRGRPP